MLTSMIAGAGLAQVYFDTACVSIRWERQCVVVEWKASASSDEFRAAQVMSIRACEENRASRILVDARNMKLGLVDDERWRSEDMLPLLALTGVRWIAIVTPADRLAGDIARTPRSSAVETRHFGTLDEARQWLSVMEIAR
jgi:stage II sporulation SpoAA-like protein